jgi:hypothetical protein
MDVPPVHGCGSNRDSCKLGAAAPPADLGEGGKGHSNFVMVATGNSVCFVVLSVLSFLMITLVCWLWRCAHHLEHGVCVAG